MRMIKTLALAAVFAAGPSAFGLAEEAAPDSVTNHEPIFDTYSVATLGPAYVPQAVTTAGPLQVPTSPWIAERFNSNRGMTAFEQNWFLRAEATNVGGNGSSD